jgi:hypothetical protein
MYVCKYHFSCHKFALKFYLIFCIVVQPQRARRVSLRNGAERPWEEAADRADETRPLEDCKHIAYFIIDTVN